MAGMDFLTMAFYSQQNPSVRYEIRKKMYKNMTERKKSLLNNQIKQADSPLAPNLNFADFFWRVLEKISSQWLSTSNKTHLLAQKVPREHCWRKIETDGILELTLFSFRPFEQFTSLPNYAPVPQWYAFCQTMYICVFCQQWSVYIRNISYL